MSAEIDDIKLSSSDQLRSEIRRISNELCRTVGGNFDFTVSVLTEDEELEQLCMLINFVLDRSRRSLSELGERNRQLADLDRMKSQFFASVSHEIRTPLTLISSPMRSLLRGEFGELSPAARDMIERVCRNSARLQLLMNDILDFSKMDSGQKVARREPIQLVGFVSRIIEEVEPLARERGLKLFFSPDSFPNAAALDPHLFERILLNLLSNALKFTPPPGEVEVILSNRGETIQLDVRDTGVGIAEDKRPTLFTRFHQGDARINREHEGTGLGLALAQEFAMLLGGHIDFESKTGHGTKFSLSLPFVPAGSPGEDREAAPPTYGARLLREALQPVHASDETRKPSVLQLPKNQARLLVVEDNPDMLHYITHLLKDEYYVLEAKSGEQALEIFARETVDLIISDITMPGIDGRAVLKDIRTRPKGQNIPFIFLTAIADFDELADRFDQGADDFIRKPFDPRELRSRIRAALRHSAAVERLKKTTQELHAIKENLEQKVEQRTLALAEQTQLAKAASHAKGRFLASMSHEIRTPLGAIVGFAEMLKESKGVTTEQMQWLNIISRNGEQLTKIINQVLDLSKIEAGQLLVEKMFFSPREMLTEVHELLFIKAREKQIGFTLEVERGVPHQVFSDAIKVRQVLVNLIGNAIKFTDCGSVHVQMGYSSSTGRLWTRVIDSGSGVKPEMVDQIFDPFVQGHSLLRGASLGTGLGLALSRELARALGGDVALEQTGLNAGSRFIFEFKPDEVIVSAGPIQAPSLKPPHSQDRRLEGKRILLAEDSPDNQILICRYLTAAGAHVTCVKNGREAVEEAQNSLYDLVLMDIQMPELDGCRATEALRSKGFITPIVALTAYALKDERDRCLRSGCNDHLTKPIDRGRLIEAIGRMIQA